MLSLFFEKALSREQDETLYDKLKGFAQRFEHDVSDCVDTKVDVYTHDDEVAREIARNLKEIGFEFDAKIGRAQPLFVQKFHEHDESKPSMEIDAIRTESVRSCVAESPIVEAGHVDDVGQLEELETPSRAAVELKPLRERAGTDDSVSESHYVTADELEIRAKKAEEQMRRIATELMKQMSSAMTSPTSSGASGACSSSSSTPKPPRNVARSAEFVAKNELIANGIRCEKCQMVIKGVSPITQLMNAVRDHVTIHFDSEFQDLKRYECRECQPEFRTNMVDEFEKHLKKHGTMMSMTEMRHRFTKHILTEKHLKLMCKMANACFPEVFEKKPPAIGTILQIDTPSRAKGSVFPRLDRIFCSKYNVPVSSTPRISQPIPLVKLT